MLATFFCIFIAGVCALAFFETALYWYETINSPEPKLMQPRFALVACIRIYAMTLGTLVLIMLIKPFGGWALRNFRVSPPRAGKDSPAPVVCIHGIYRDAASWLYLGRRIRKMGHPVSAFCYESMKGSPEDIMRALDRHIQDVEAACPGKKPVLVCHSMGGLLARLWLSEQNAARCGGVITLGTPHKGSKLAVFAQGSLGPTICPGGLLVEAVNRPEALAQAASVPCVSIVTGEDGAVLPGSSLVPPEGWRLRDVQKNSHFGMLFCPRTAAVVQEELQALA